MKGLEDLGRVRLSKNFYLRDFLMSEIANFYGVPNLPENPDLAIELGTYLCNELLEPMQDRFGRIAIRSGYRSAKVCEFGNNHGHGASVKYNSAYHIWDRLDADGRKGAAACIVIPWFADLHDEGADWRGGFTTTCPAPTSNFIPSSPPSTCCGAKNRGAGSTVS